MTINFGTKPFNTKIQLTTGGDYFEIYIPPIGFHPVMRLIVPFAISWNGFIAVWTFAAARSPFPVNIFFILFSSPFWVVGGFLAYACLSILFAKTFLRIDSPEERLRQRHEICLIKTLFGQKVSRQPPAPKREISRLIFTREYSYHDSDGESTQPAELKIEIGKIDIGAQPIIVGGVRGGIEHESEVEWLAYEISEWLDKPLTIIESSLDYSSPR